MWTEQLPNGKYKFCERYTDPLTGRSRRLSVVLDKNTKQAQKQAGAVLNAKYEALCAPKVMSITLGELVELYLDEQKQTVKMSTWKRNYFAVHSIMGILGENVMVDKLTAGYIRRQFLATGNEPGTLNERLVRLKAMLRWAYKNDYIDDIRYLDKLEPFKDIPHRQKIEDKFLEGEELTALLDGMTIKKWHDLTEFLALSGLRFGEAAALERSDLDLKQRIITVNKNYDSTNHVTTTPKTYTSNREVYMQDELYALCRQLLATSYITSNIIPITNLVFTDSTGKYIGFAGYNHYLQKISLKTIGRKITPHTLRHTHASLMMENGMDIDAIAARLGHTDSRITREIYLHVTEKLKEKQNAQIKEIKIFAP